jgi:hypothetical protein
MKYSEYLQFRELLEKNGISLEEYKKDPKLYEGVIGNIMKKLGGSVITLAGKGIKYAISKGINGEFQKKLDKDITDIKNNIEAHLGLEGKVPPKDSPVQKVLTAKNNRTVSKRTASTKIIKYMDDLVDDKSKIVLKSIDNKKGLTDDDKDNLKIYWGSKIADVKLNLIAQLGQVGASDKETIEEESEILHKNLNKYIAILLADARKRAASRGKTAKPAPKPAPKPTAKPTPKPATKPTQKQTSKVK